MRGGDEEKGRVGDEERGRQDSVIKSEPFVKSFVLFVPACRQTGLNNFKTIN